MTKVNPADLAVRPAVDADAAFLRRLGDDVRQPDFTPLLAAGKEELFHTVLKQQHETQLDQYQAGYGNAHFGIVTLCGAAIGKLFLDYGDKEVRIVDFALMSTHRGHGIGGIVLQGVCMEAGLRGVPVRAMVQETSRAMAFYRRAGFQVIDDASPFSLLEWRHPDPGSLARGWFRLPT